MSRSPPLQQQQQQHTLTFTDQDLTDTYRDTASFSAASHRSAASHSTTNNRHPRGDTPLSHGGRRGGRGVRAGSTSSATSGGSLSSRGAQGGRGGEMGSMPFLSRLMAFLDDEDEGTRLQNQHQQNYSPSFSSIHRQQLPRSSTPPIASPAPHQQQTQHDEHTHSTTQSTTAAASESTASPSLRAHSRSQLRRDRSLSSASNPRAPPPSARQPQIDGAGEELPESPSPLPGSVAGLSWRQAQAQGNSALGGNGGQRGVAGRTEKQQEEEEEVTLLYEGGVGAEGGGWEVGGPRVGERDGITDLADEVLSEFTSIINSAPTSPNQPRPRSRLRNIPSPPSSSVSGGASPRMPMPVKEEEEARSSEEEGEEGRRGKKVGIGGWRSGNGHGIAGNGPIHPPSPPQSLNPSNHSPNPSPQQPQHDLLAELREARAYIARLQGELRELGEVVGGLRGSSGTPAEMRRRRDPAPPPAPRVEREEKPLQLDGSPCNTLAVAHHLIALLPSNTSSSLSTLPPPSLHSISLALSFVRDIDSLVHHSRAPTPLGGVDTAGEGREVRGDWRRDEQVFQRENLELVRRRVRGWERSVRGGQ